MKLKLLYCFMLITMVNYGQTLDQNVPYTSSNAGYGFSNPGFELGQIFTAGITGDLSQINLWTSMNDDGIVPCIDATNTVRLKIYSGAGNGGSVVGYSDNVDVGVQSCTETIFAFTTPISITSGNMYTMIFEQVTSNCNTTVACQNSNGTYTGGSAWHQSIGNDGNNDTFFKTFVDDGTLSVNENNLTLKDVLLITNNHISVKLEDDVIYNIFDLTGKVIRKGTESEIDISDLDVGIYVIGINHNIRKLFIKR